MVEKWRKYSSTFAKANIISCPYLRITAESDCGGSIDPELPSEHHLDFGYLGSGQEGLDEALPLWVVRSHHSHIDFHVTQLPGFLVHVIGFVNRRSMCWNDHSNIHTPLTLVGVEYGTEKRKTAWLSRPCNNMGEGKREEGLLKWRKEIAQV